MQIPPISSLGLTGLLVMIAVSLILIARLCLGEYDRHVRWHDLRVRCQRMRRDRLMAMLDHQTQQEALSSKRSVPVIRQTASDDASAPGGGDGGDGDGDGVAGRIEPATAASPAPARIAA